MKRRGILTLALPVCGMMALSIHGIHAQCWHWALQPPLTPRCPIHHSGCSGCSAEFLEEEAKEIFMQQRTLVWQHGQLNADLSFQALENAVHNQEALTWLDVKIEDDALQCASMLTNLFNLSPLTL